MKKLSAFCLVLALVLSLSGCFYHSSPDAAMEAVGIGSSQRARFGVDGCYFYYQTVADNFDNPGQIGDWLYVVTPVRKGDLGLWYASPDPRSYVVKSAAEGKAVGTLVPVQVNGDYHNFFIPFFEGNDPVALPQGLPRSYDRVTVGGQEIELFQHAYFVTQEAVETFEIGGMAFVVDG